MSTEGKMEKMDMKWDMKWEPKSDAEPGGAHFEDLQLYKDAHRTSAPAKGKDSGACAALQLGRETPGT